MTTLLNSSLGRYHITSLLGEGGMAIVYKAYDTRLETEVLRADLTCLTRAVTDQNHVTDTGHV